MIALFRFPPKFGLELETFEEGKGFAELREATLICFEFPGMNAASEAMHLDRMLEVKHLVVEEVLNRVTRAGGTVEDAAYDDGVVCGVVVAKGAASHAFAPSEFGTAEHSMKKADVERIEDFFEVIEVALWAGVALATAGVADEFSLARDGGAGGEPLEADVVRGIDWLLVELGEEDVCDGVNDALGSAFDEIGKAYEDFAFAQTNGGVERCETAEADRDGRDGRARAKCAVFVFKDGN